MKVHKRKCVDDITSAKINSSEEILFSGTEVKAESVDDLVESLLKVIKAEIKNLDEDIEALQRQKSDLKIWQNLSRN